MKYEYESITSGVFRFTIPGEHRTVELFKGTKVIVPQLLTGSYLRLLRLVRKIDEEQVEETVTPATKEPVKKTTTQKAKVADKITAVTETAEVPKETVEVETTDTVVAVKETTDTVVAVKETKTKPAPKKRARKKKAE